MKLYFLGREGCLQSFILLTHLQCGCNAHSTTPFNLFECHTLFESASFALNDDNRWGKVILVTYYHNIRKLLISFPPFVNVLPLILCISPSRVVAYFIHLNKIFLSWNYHCFLDFWKVNNIWYGNRYLSIRKTFLIILKLD